uniref:HAT C-terminal dimerisation domain-containing protein n=1 Tax=Latimeria chalumnae TaxID=7897 RepID=H2ZU17_LATCH
MDGNSLAILIKSTLSALELDLSALQGQCYDGAASMRGAYKGVTMLIHKENPLTYYVHCYAHILNLCIVDMVSSIPVVQNAFGILQALQMFIEGSSKRHAVFKKMTSEKESFGGPTTLKSLSDTRWNCQVESIRAVLEKFDEMVEPLCEITTGDSKAGSEAYVLLRNVQDFNFLHCMFFMWRVLMQTNQLSKLLQSKELLYHTAMTMAKSTVSVLKEMRCDDFASKIFHHVYELCQKNNYPGPCVPCKGVIPKNLGGGQKSVFQKPEDYSRSKISYRILDTLINEIKDCFSENDVSIFASLLDVLSSEFPSEESVVAISTTYSIDQEDLNSEIQMFKDGSVSTSSDKEELTQFERKLQFFCEMALCDTLSNLANLVVLYLSIPMTSALAKKNFSFLHQLKTYLRSTMTDARVSALTILQIEKEIIRLLREIKRSNLLIESQTSEI